MSESPAVVSNHSQTLSRGIQMLEVLAEADSGITIGELARILGLHRSVTYRILRTLEDHGLVIRNEAGIVTLGSRMAYLARNVAAGLQTAVQPELIDAANELGVTCFLAVLDHAECITLLSAEPTAATAAVVQRPGSRHSLTVGAPGLAIQSSLTKAEWHSLAPGIPPRPEVALAAELGYATSHDEVIAGVSSVAVPLRIEGQSPATIAAVFVTGAADMPVIAARLQQAVTRVTQHRR